MTNRTWHSAAGLIVFLLAALGCAAAETKAPAKPPAKPAAFGKTVIITSIPHVQQKPDFCGEACVEMYMKYDLRLDEPIYSIITQDDVFAASKLNPRLGRGCYAPNLHAALKTLGFKLAANNRIWQSASTVITNKDKKTVPSLAALNTLTAKCFGELLADLRKGVPSIVCMHYNDKPNTTEHFRMVVGYDAAKDEVLYREPALAPLKAKPTGYLPYRRMAREAFFKLWPISGGAKKKSLIRFGLTPGKTMLWSQKAVWKKLSDGKLSAPTNPSPADYAQHIIAIKKKYPFLKKGYAIGCEGPFVVVGNTSAAGLNRYLHGTIRWAHKHFRADFFPKNPPKIITVFLLTDKTTYKAVAKAVSGTPPNTPYGYFSPSHNAMVMNILTGGGTLVHEMFHAYGPANDPTMPGWVNEGMGSLYEQCGVRKVAGKEQLIGRTNWRLASLQKHIRAKTTVPFDKLCQSSDNQFYSTAGGYAQARYLMYYLQQNHKLRAFWATYSKTRKADPTGWAAMKTTLAGLGHTDIKKFQTTWEAWCLKLRFP
jgi:hypothetical protein